MQIPTLFCSSKYKTSRLIFVALILLVFVVSSCEKGNDPEPSVGDGRLSKLIERSGDSLGITYFDYDHDNGHRLKSVTSEYHGMLFFRKHFYYDGSGKLVKTLMDDLLNSNAPDQVDTFLYSNNLITSKLSLTNPGVKYFYQYNGAGHLTNNSLYFSSAPDPYAYGRFSYDIDGNLTEWEYFSGFGGSFNSPGIYRATYTDHVNPFGSARQVQNIVSSGLEVSNLFFSKNLPQELIYPGGTVEEFDYEVYSNGLPRLLSRKSSGWGARTTEFFYE